MAYFWLFTFNDPNAQNSTCYTLSVASALQGGLGSTVTPAQGKTIAGRPTADLTARTTVSSLGLDIYAVTFSSEVYKVTHLLAFYARSDIAPQFQSTWNSVANSFRVTGESPAPSAANNTWLLGGIISAVAVAAVLVVALVFARRKRAPALIPPTSPTPRPR